MQAPLCLFARSGLLPSSILRFGLTPLYLGYADVWDTVEALRDILDNRLWDTPEYQFRGAVT